MKKRGFTLLEMMIVVAIAGVMAGLAASALQQMLAIGRVNGTAQSITRMMQNARMRSATMNCGVSAQINGPTYAPAGPVAGFPANPATAFVFVKTVCSSAGPINGFFELGDRVIATFPMQEQRVTITLPAGLNGAGVLGAGSLVVNWSNIGGAFTRRVYVDTGGGYIETPGFGGLDISFSPNGAATPSGIASVPDIGIPYVIN